MLQWLPAALNLLGSGLDYMGGREQSKKAGKPRPLTPQEEFFFNKQRESLDGNDYRGFLTNYILNFLKTANDRGPTFEPQFKSNYMQGQSAPPRMPSIAFPQFGAPPAPQGPPIRTNPGAPNAPGPAPDGVGNGPQNMAVGPMGRYNSDAIMNLLR